MSRERDEEPRSRGRFKRLLKWGLVFLFLAAVVFLFVRNRQQNKEPTITVEGGELTPAPMLPTVAAPPDAQASLPTAPPPAPVGGTCPDPRRQIPADRVADPAAPQFVRDWAASSGCYPLDIQGTAALLPEPFYGGQWTKGDADFGTPFDQQLGSWSAHPGTLVMVENATTQERCYALVVGSGPAVGSSHGSWHFFVNEALGRCLIQSHDLPANFAVEVLVRMVNITPDP